MENLENLRSLFFQEAELCLSVYDEHLNCIDFNQAFLKIFKCKREDLIGKNLCEISPDLKSSGRYDIYKNVIKTGKSAEINQIQPHINIGDYYFRIKAFKVGEGLGLIVKDITDFVESINRFNYAANASLEIIYEWDIENNTLWLNDTYYFLLGLEEKKGQLTFKDYINFIHPEDKERMQKQVEQLSFESINYCSEEYRIIDKNDVVQYFSERAYFIQDRTGKIIKKIASVKNVSDLKLHIYHLENILFELSHKVRQPVCNILGLFYLMDKKLITDEEQNKSFVYLKDAVELLDKYTKDITSLLTDYKSTTKPFTIE